MGDFPDPNLQELLRKLAANPPVQQPSASPTGANSTLPTPDLMSLLQFFPFQELIRKLAANTLLPNPATSSTVSTPLSLLQFSPSISSPSLTDMSSSSSSSATSPNDTISSIDSGISSPSIILRELDSLEKTTTPGGRSRQRIRRDWCAVCNSSIVKNGCRSQGPRRHIMQHHLMKPMFLCPVPNCDFSSNYDKAHVHAHIRRMHPGLAEEARVIDKKVYQQEEDLWMERCFGVNKTSRVSNNHEEKENQPSPVKKEEETESEKKQRHPFSINTLLTPRSTTPVQPLFSPLTPLQRSIQDILDQADKFSAKKTSSG